MSTYVLVHGAWHGAWCWDKVAPLLRAHGHTVLIPDLPGHGDDPTPLEEVTLDAYADRVADFIDSAAEPVILVGHSMGGIVVTQAAELRSDAVAKLVYLTGFLPGNGESLLDLAADDPGTLVLPNLITSEDGVSATVAPDFLTPAFYADCSDDDVAWATAHLVPQALAPLATPVSTTDQGWGSVPRIYFECAEDQAISITRQRDMVGRHPVESVVTFETSHSPFLSQPAALADALLAV
jgi:pimeloyl-ACP methyl ester carboxylesterase